MKIRRQILVSRSMWVFALFLIILNTGCSYDNMVYKYGNGIKDAINGATSAIACSYVPVATCVTAGAVKGYIDGKQEARDKIVAKDDAKLIKKLAEAKAKDMGVEVDNCWFWCD